MRWTLLSLVASAAVAAGPVFAQDVVTTNWDDGAAVAPSCETSCEAVACDGCGTCDSCCKGIGVVLFGGIDAFQSVADSVIVPGLGFSQNREGSFGIKLGGNVAVPISSSGFSVQSGMSYGVYDFHGRPNGLPGLVFAETASSMEQLFITTGLFHRPDSGDGLAYGLVYDWMAADNYGVWSNEPFLGQWRAKIEYAFTRDNSIGVWATKRDNGDSQLPIPGTESFPLARRAFKPTSQVNLFFHHRFASGADGRLYMGIVEGNRLGSTPPPALLGSGQGSLADVTFGGDLNVPISNRLASYASVYYAKPSSRGGVGGGASEDSWNVSVGIAIYPGRDARMNSVLGNRNQPFLPVANNGSFLVDAALQQ